ncbi:hypothetical protein NLJ89_g8743 [Agrocybe chaxingu]|uniref:WD40 repeat-like protein n=1 Tax=Agrocybe chaxingu TaxID=84603 RepID=A0A9W8JU33_9AGAR|nr:hypothetical protein NLJ89_g8743 [Agrocybe chaxingu]
MQATPHAPMLGHSVMTLQLNHIFRLTGYQDTVYALAFSPDGSKLASASLDGAIRVWSTTTGRPLVEPLRRPYPLTSIAWWDDNTMLAGMNEGGLLVITTKNVRSSYLHPIFISPARCVRQKVLSAHFFPLHSYPIEYITSQLSRRLATAAKLEILISSFEKKTGLPKEFKVNPPLSTPPVQVVMGEVRDVVVSGLHWAPAFGDDALLVTYQSHGIIIWDAETASTIRLYPIPSLIAASSFLNEHKLLAISNHTTGFNIYNLDFSGRARNLEFDIGDMQRGDTCPIFARR